MSKIKESILKETREKQLVTCKGTPIGLSADFSVDILKDRREGHVIFKLLKGKNLQHKVQQGYLLDLER